MQVLCCVVVDKGTADGNGKAPDPQIIQVVFVLARTAEEAVGAAFRATAQAIPGWTPVGKNLEVCFSAIGGPLRGYAQLSTPGGQTLSGDQIRKIVEQSRG